MTCIQGIELKVTAEDISELFNYIDDKAENKIKKKDFTSAISYVLQKVSGSTASDNHLIKGIRATQKGASNIQLVLQVMK